MGEVARIIYQIYIALKVTPKVMNEVTYSWNQFLKLFDSLMKSVVGK